MLQKIFDQIYLKFKLNLYRNMFRGLQEREASLTATETFAVEVIHALNRPTVNELANFLELSQPNTTYKVASLVKKGYVRKVPSKLDKRKILLEVTDKFYSYYNLKNEYVEEVLSRLSDRVSPQKLTEFEEILNLMSNELMPEVSHFINSEQEDTNPDGGGGASLSRSFARDAVVPEDTTSFER